jgi:hypothetical protein
MRAALYLVAAGAAAILDPGGARNVFATASSVLLECLPYLAATALLWGILGTRLRHAMAFAGCGCTRGPSARSIPGAVAVALLFGPLAALIRVTVASIVAHFLRRSNAHDHGFSALSELAALAPAAGAASLLAAMLPNIVLHTHSRLAAIGIGMLLGTFATPCALGNAAVAASLRAQMPVAAAAYLCIAGIIDMNVWFRRATTFVRHDAFAYVVLAGACALAARSSGLVHPRIAIALVPSAAFFLACAWRYRSEHDARLRALPLALVGALVIGAPAPVYTATETTLSEIFPGERIDFTGVVVPSRTGTALVRYAITCCRADARPVAIRLSRALPVPARSWVHARGVIARRGDELVLDARSAQLAAPPADPYVYR